MSRCLRQAFLLLKFRQRSTSELRSRLRSKGFSEDLVRDALVFLKQKKFIDDKLFARDWISSRAAKSYGSRRIIRELRIKGVDEDVIEAQIERSGLLGSEDEIAARLARSRLERLKGVDLASARRRVYSFLIRRGFSHEAASNALGQQ